MIRAQSTIRAMAEPLTEAMVDLYLQSQVCNIAYLPTSSHFLNLWILLRKNVIRKHRSDLHKTSNRTTFIHLESWRDGFVELAK